MTSSNAKFRLLMWKQWTLTKRRIFSTFLQFLIPTIICSVYILVRFHAELKKVQIYSPFTVSLNCTGSVIIAYSPSSPLLYRIISNMCPTSKIVEFETAAKLNKEIETNAYATKALSFAVLFSDELKGINSTTDYLPNNLDITLRLPSLAKPDGWMTHRLYPKHTESGPRMPDAEYDGRPNYKSRGFLSLQQTITLAFINNGEIEPPKVQIDMQRFPYPEWFEDEFYSSKHMEANFGIFLRDCFIFFYFLKIKDITLEKERQLKESMKAMGMPLWLHWTSWFVYNFIILLILVALVLCLTTIKIGKDPLFKHSDPTVLMLLFILYGCCLMAASFLFSALFSKASTGTTVGIFAVLFSSMPYLLILDDDIVLGSALAASLLVGSTICYGAAVIVKFENVGEGIQWSNVGRNASPADNLSLVAIFIMFIIDIFLYLALAMYVEAIHPGEFGIAKPWNFLCTSSFWCSDTSQSTDTEVQSKKNEGNFEEFTGTLPVGIQLKDLSKTFGSHAAVINLNLKIYQGHITVLLGHNGAGKTTTMSMITGMISPTRGTVKVSGYDVRTQVQLVRDSMGLCLQHNILFDELTVYEHLYFFGKLKGLQNDEIDNEIDYYITLLELDDKRKARSKTLSGGIKRKLNVGIALIGKSKVVILDEPTAGMDPSARRTIWNVLQKQKKDRTILLSTHFMDEADLLGDRIAIMSDGEMQCCGSSFYLKKKYGAGYYLILEVTPRCQPKKVTDFLRNHISSLQVHSQVGSELTYKLPDSESKKFEIMLSDLERNLASLGIESYGISIASLEEVFLKVGADDNTKMSKMLLKGNMNRSRINAISFLSVTIGKSTNKSEVNYLTGFPMIINQCLAMLLKKFLSFIRSWLLFLFTIIIVPVLMVIVIIVNRQDGDADSQGLTPPLKITLDSYTNPVTLLAGIENNYYKMYEQVLKDHHLTKVRDISEEILQLTSKSPSNVKQQYIVAASFTDNVSTAWFNGDPFHSPPLALGLILNTIFKDRLGVEKSVHYFNNPLPLTVEAQIDEFWNLVGSLLAMSVVYGMIFAIGSLILFVIRERVCKIKHLQFVCGVNAWIFWSVSFLCDLIVYFVTLAAVIIAIMVLDIEGYRTSEELSRITIVLVYFGFFVIPFIYLIAYICKTPAGGFVCIFALAFIGMFGRIVAFVLEIFDMPTASKYVDWILLFNPFYSLETGMILLGNRHITKDKCQALGSLKMACLFISRCCDVEDYYSMDRSGIGRNISIAFGMCILLFIILILIEYGFFNCIINLCCVRKESPDQDTILDGDVQEEKLKIKNTDQRILNDTYVLVLRDLTKYYRKLRAVNGLCLGIQPYECFGLLGANGAGKTTTFKMMTGDERISSGDAWIHGLNVKTDQKKIQKIIGYCPQFDGLLDDFTCRETLTMFALIRGVPTGKCQTVCEGLAEDFDFLQHLDKKVRQLSGGNKRKLSTALSLIGDPLIIFLDEPTTGMDPKTKRFIWNALAKLRESGKCIVLSSHSMEECEALCTRIVIMVNGNFQCLGSIQRLKSKFAQGYGLIIKVKKSANLKNYIATIDQFVKNNFSGAHLTERYHDILTYRLPDTSLPYSQMFGIIERDKNKLNIEDYSLAQCSLEDVGNSPSSHDTKVCWTTLLKFYWRISQKI